MAAARDLPAQAHNRAADNIADADCRRGPALLQPSATIQPAAPSARKQQAILTPKVPVRMVPGHIRRRRTNRNHDCRPARAPNKPDPPARPNRGATLFYIGNTRHTRARGWDILLVTRIRIVARRRKGGRRAPHDTYRPSDRRAESGTRIAGAPMAATEQAADRTPDGIVAIGAGREPPKPTSPQTGCEE
jgi:hypothetical protein